MLHAHQTCLEKPRLQDNVLMEAVSASLAIARDAALRPYCHRFVAHFQLQPAMEMLRCAEMPRRGAVDGGATVRIVLHPSSGVVWEDISSSDYSFVRVAGNELQPYPQTTRLSQCLNNVHTK
jgi:hypothetical protein